MQRFAIEMSATSFSGAMHGTNGVAVGICGGWGVAGDTLGTGSTVAAATVGAGVAVASGGAQPCAAKAMSASAAAART
jgi:hypothetical protein